MNIDALMKLLRALLSFAIGYASAKGYLTPSDANAITQFCIEVGPIIIPAGLALYANWNQKSVPQASIAVTADNVHPASNVVGNVVNVGTAKIVGALLLAMIVFAPGNSYAGPIGDKIKADAEAKIVQLKTIVIDDVTAARDDARANSDPSAACWIIILEHANTMPPKLMGLAHTAQRLRTLRRSLPAILDACAVVKDGARQALLQIFGTAAGGVTGLAAMGL